MGSGKKRLELSGIYTERRAAAGISHQLNKWKKIILPINKTKSQVTVCFRFFLYARFSLSVFSAPLL